MLDTKKILANNRDTCLREMDVYNLPAVRNFSQRFVKPSAAAGETADAFNYALGEVEDAAFVVGFNTAVRFLVDCMRGGNGQ